MTYWNREHYRDPTAGAAMWNAGRANRKREEAKPGMTRMELENYKRWDEEISRLQEQIDELRDGGLKSPRLTGMPKAAKMSGDMIGSRIAKLTSLEESVRDLKLRQARIRETIGRLQPTEMRALWFRYIDGMSWERIAEKMQYSVRFIRQIHDRAIRNLEAGPRL